MSSDLTRAAGTPIGRLLIVALASTVLLACAADLHAGFTDTRGGRVGYPLGGENTPESHIPGTMEAIQGLDGVNNEAEASAMLQKMRANLRTASELLIRISPVTGAAVWRMASRGLVNADFGSSSARASAWSDPEDGISDGDRININVDALTGGVLAMHDPVLVNLTGTLLHEATHALEGVPAMTTPPANALEKSALQQTRARREMDAEQAKIDFYDVVLTSLAHLADPANNPEPTQWAAQGIVDSIKALPTQAERDKARDELKKFVDKDRASRVGVLTVMQQVFTVNQLFTTGVIDAAERNRQIRSIRRTRTGRKIRWARTFAATWSPNDSTIDQLADAGPSVLQTGHASPRVIYMTSAGVLLASGLNAAGEGGVVGFVDTNGDEAFDDGERVTVVPYTSVLSESLGLFEDDYTGVSYIFDADSGSVFALDDVDADGTPDALGSDIVAPGLIPDDVLDFYFTADGRLFAQDWYMDDQLEYFQQEEFNITLYELTDPDSDGIFDMIVRLIVTDGFSAEPSILGGATDGSEQVDVWAIPGNTIQIIVHDADGVVLEVLADFVAGGFVTAGIDLNRPLLAGERLSVFDITDDIWGPTDMVPEPATMGLMALGGLAALARRRRAALPT